MPTFSDIAIKLSRNPLGIIALFLVLIYSIACLTFYNIQHLTESQTNYLDPNYAVAYNNRAAAYNKLDNH
jgi:hypothetical protein